ncbi:hypothetical protein [Chitinophaga vietnamensis]|uniref:hypothetical protein n=1 Tax=Chitinophaga vietnamensis TaxID=2593957 RepID=UPI001178A70D|nr:hypothetical protein [Chitinophaga vietnamensis]
MKRFININQSKLRFFAKVLFLAFAILFAGLYVIPIAHRPTALLLVLLHFGLTALATVIAVLIILLGGYEAYRRQQAQFASPFLAPLLAKYRFQPLVTDPGNNWALSGEMMAGCIESYPVAIYSTLEKPAIVHVAILVDLSRHDLQHYTSLQQTLAQYKFQLAFSCVLRSGYLHEKMNEEIVLMLDLTRRMQLQPSPVADYHTVMM